MTPEERAQLVESYISNYTSSYVWCSDMVLREERGEEQFWAFEAMAELSRSDPMLCWELILQILHTPHTDSVTESLAAGPLEDLLANHGEQLIELVEKTAIEDSLFKDLLGGVWKNSMSPQVWGRLQACRGALW